MPEIKRTATTTTTKGWSLKKKEWREVTTRKARERKRKKRRRKRKRRRRKKRRREREREREKEKCAALCAINVANNQPRRRRTITRTSSETKVTSLTVARVALLENGKPSKTR